MYTLVVVVVLLGLFFAFNSYIYNQKQAPGPVTSDTPPPVEITLAGEVKAVDLEQVAIDGPALIVFETTEGESYTVSVPTMGLLQCAAKDAIANVYEIKPGEKISVSGTLQAPGHIVPCASSAHYLVAENSYTDESLGYSFSYAKDYTLSSDRALSEDASYLSGVELTVKGDEAVGENTEGAPTILIRVYQNDEKLEPAEWVKAHPLESNIELALTKPTEAVVSGAKGVQYTTDGLYATDTFVVSSTAHMYVITGSFLDIDSDLHQQFMYIVDTFSFAQEIGLENE